MNFYRKTKEISISTAERSKRLTPERNELRNDIRSRQTKSKQKQSEEYGGDPKAGCIVANDQLFLRSGALLKMSAPLNINISVVRVIAVL
jgi:hypothetical protein